MSAENPSMSEQEKKEFLSALYDEYHDMVQRAISWTITDKNDLDDLTIEVFVKLMKKTSVLRGLDCHKRASYVVNTARNVTINFIKHRDVHNKHVAYVEDMDLLPMPEWHTDSVVERAIRRQTIDEMLTTISRLPERLRTAMLAKYFLNEDDASIAKLLGVAPVSVGKYLARARQAVKEMLVEGVKPDARTRHEE